jgi:hypothetical protein
MMMMRMLIITMVHSAWCTKLSSGYEEKVSFWFSIFISLPLPSPLSHKSYYMIMPTTTTTTTTTTAVVVAVGDYWVTTIILSLWQHHLSHIWTYFLTINKNKND